MYQARQLKTTEQPSDHVNQKRTQRDGERFLVNIIFDDTQNSFTHSNEWLTSWNTVVASIPGMNRRRLAMVQFPSMRSNIITVLSQTNLNMQRRNL